MKKKLSVIAVIILVLAICVSAWFYGYYNHKSNDNLTSENGTACWKMGNDTILVVSYKNNGIVAICGLKDDSGTSIGE